jgi:16S rRNA (uracil1498-N3)-methyltransferase
MTRFFIPAEQIQGNSIILKGSDRHHLLNVLRREVGSTITVLNGRGAEYEAVIKEIGPDFVTGEIVAIITKATEPRVKIRLVQSLPKADKFEWLLQKNTEIGVSFFQPAFTERSAIKLEPAAVLKKEERWRKIIREAAEQSGRKIVPQLEPVRNWNQVLATISEKPGLALIPWEGERECSLKKVLEGTAEIPETVTIFIGPEGGFSQAEIDQARNQGAVPVTLGPRILRTETAGLVVATAIFYHYGDLG